MSEEDALIASEHKARNEKMQNETELQPLKIDLSDTAFQNTVEEDVRTSAGTTMRVAVQGDRSRKAAIVTMHDLGMDYVSCFQSLFCFHQLQPVLKHFCVYHVNFPGQERNSQPFADDYVYPTMDEVASMLKEVIDFYRIKCCIGFGVGAGANVFLRLGLKFPDSVEGLVLVNGTCSAASWSEWGYQKVGWYGNQATSESYGAPKGEKIRKTNFLIPPEFYNSNTIL